MNFSAGFTASAPRPFPAMGCWNFAGDYWTKQSREINRKILRAALESGISHFDSAPAYGHGESEQVLGQLLRKELLKKSPGERENLTVSSKFFPTLPENVYKGLRRSLNRLLLDYIDIYYIHWPNEKCDMGGILEELARAREEGLIRNIGISNFSMKQMNELLKFITPDYCQTGYSLLWRYPEREIIPWCRAHGVKIIAYSPLAQGLLKDTPGGNAVPSPEDPRRQLIFFRNEDALEGVLKHLSAAVRREGFSLSEAALGWLREGSMTDGILSGFRTPEQAVALADLSAPTAPPLPASLIAELNGISEDYCRSLENSNPGADNIWDHHR